tara:strand:+ start:1981 stop:3432 length:1452 start_codon:yes stop_codon:yes gene_type:complete
MTKARDLANFVSGTSSTIDTAEITNSAITNDKLGSDISAAKLAAGTVPTARLGSGTANSSTFLAGDSTYKVAATEYDDNKIVNDISTLALHQATNNNSAKYNLTNSNVDVYQDSSAIANLTNVTRDATGEYISSVSDNMPTGTQLYLKSNSSPNNSTTIADYSGNSVAIQFDGGGKHISQGDVPIGATSSTKSTSAFWFNGTQEIKASHSAMETPLDFRTGDFTMSTYWRANSGTTSTRFFNMGGIGSLTDYNGMSWDYIGGEEKMAFYYRTGGTTQISVKSAGLTTQNDTWYHLAVTRQSGVIKFWKNGVQSGSNHNEAYDINMANADSRDFKIGIGSDGENGFQGRMDAMHIIKGSALYTGTFTPPTVYYGTSSNATGSYESTAQTANTSVNKISGVVTYTNESGTNTLNTDIVLQVSADNGSNWSNATLTAAGTFSSGVLQAVTNDISVTAGTQLKYKISFANQATGSKVARINGVSLSY